MKFKVFRQRARAIMKCFQHAIDDLPHCGYAIEPIAVVDDPNDEIKGDYVIRICFEHDIEEGKVFSTAFQAYILMTDMVTFPPKRVAFNMKTLVEEAEKFRAESERNIRSGDSTRVTADGIVGLSTAVERLKVEIYNEVKARKKRQH